MKQYKTMGIVPRWDFEAKGMLEGVFVRTEVVKSKTEKKKDFSVYIVRDLNGKEWSVSGGHIDYLMEKWQVKPAQGLRLTFVGWNDMEEGKARNYSLELEAEPS